MVRKWANEREFRGRREGGGRREGRVSQRMECGDHWLIYAQLDHGGVLDQEASTAVHHRRSGANY